MLPPMPVMLRALAVIVPELFQVPLMVVTPLLL